MDPKNSNVLNKIQREIKMITITVTSKGYNKIV